jgi:hypothetical protein
MPLAIGLRVQLIAHTNISSNIAVESREDQVAVCELLCCALLHDQVANALRERQRLLPLDSILVLLARRALRSTNSVQNKVRVKLQQQDEALAYRARGAEHTCNRKHSNTLTGAIAVPHFFLGKFLLFDVKLTASMFAGSDMVGLSQSALNKFMSDDAAGGVIWIGGDRSQRPTTERESANSKFHNH